MYLDPIVEELHRHREELYGEFGSDPVAFVRHLQEREKESGRRVKAPEAPPDPVLRRTRSARR
jgi:hypothetical protein